MANKELPKMSNGLVDIDSSPSPEKSDPDDTPLNPIFCLKKRKNMQELEQREECFILGFDPDDDDDGLDVDVDDYLNMSKRFCVRKNLESCFASDVSVVAEKGQIACRDFPHPRHVCAKHPFERTAHESYCELCYCYVCDVPAPCKNWTGLTSHCNAIDNEGWKVQRKAMRQALKPRN